MSEFLLPGSPSARAQAELLDWLCNTQPETMLFVLHEAAADPGTPEDARLVAVYWERKARRCRHNLSAVTP